MEDSPKQNVDRLWKIFRNPFEPENAKQDAFKKLVEMKAYEELRIIVDDPYENDYYKQEAFRTLTKNPKENSDYLRNIVRNPWTPEELKKQAAEALKEDKMSASPRKTDEDLRSFDYDIALSFASEDREYADALARALEAKQVKSFYDDFEKSKLWGEDLYSYLADLYSKRARYCVMFLSKHYATKYWTNHERKAAQSRAFKENRAYILPIRLDDTEIPGILDTTGYIEWNRESVDKIVQYVLEKLQQK